MFVGEGICLVVYILRESFSRTKTYTAIVEEDANDVTEIEDIVIDSLLPSARIPLTGKLNFLLWIPTLCDMIATTLMNVGLIFVSASVYQMLRGIITSYSIDSFRIYCSIGCNSFKDLSRKTTRNLQMVRTWLRIFWCHGGWI